MKRVVLVTGASSGIGRAVAVWLARKGYIVYGASRSGNGAQADSLTNIPMDVTVADSVADVFKQIEAKHESLYAIVNSAGLGMLGAIEDSTDQEIEVVFQTNLVGVHHVCMQALHLLRKSDKAYIINITSIAAQMGLPYRGIYCASKFAVEGYSESLSQELAGEGIHVVLVEPGDVRTGINGNRKEAENISIRNAHRHAAIREQVNREVDGGMEPEEIAKSVCRILQIDRPRLRYRIAHPQARIAYYLMRILPDRWFERLIRKHYRS